MNTFDLVSPAQAQRGPYTVWNQTYVGEVNLKNQSAEDELGSEIELVVRDLLISDEVDIEDITAVVSYKLENRGVLQVGVYTLGVVIRGYPIGVPEVELASWGPDGSSVVHRLTFSEIMSPKAKQDAWVAFQAMNEMYESDETAVQLKQYARSILRKKLCFSTLWEKVPRDPFFKESDRWIGRDPESRALCDSMDVSPASTPSKKRKSSSFEESPGKRAKQLRTVGPSGSISLHC